MLVQWTGVLWNWCTGRNVDLISHFCMLRPWAVFWSHCCCCIKSVMPDHIRDLCCVLTLPILIVQDLLLFCINLGTVPVVLCFILQFYKCKEKLHLGFYIPLTSWNLLERVQVGPWISAGALGLHLFQLCFLIPQSLYSCLAGSAVCCFWYKVQKCSFYYSREGRCSVFIDRASLAFISVPFVIYLHFLLAFPTFLFPLL